MAKKGQKVKDQIVGIVLLNIISDTFFSLIIVKTNPYIFKKTLSLPKLRLSLHKSHLSLHKLVITAH